MTHYTQSVARFAHPRLAISSLKRHAHPEPRPHPPHLDRIEKAFRFKAHRTAQRRFDPEDHICSRALTGPERTRMLALLKPDQSSLTRCAAAHVIAELGMVKALPLLKRMIGSGIRSPHVKAAFEFAVRRIDVMKAQDDCPNSHEHLAILRKMMSSHQSVVRFLAEKVLTEANIKHGTIPGWTIPGWASERDFRDELPGSR